MSQSQFGLLLKGSGDFSALKTQVTKAEQEANAATAATADISTTAQAAIMAQLNTQPVKDAIMHQVTDLQSKYVMHTDLANLIQMEGSTLVIGPNTGAQMIHIGPVGTPIPVEMNGSISAYCGKPNGSLTKLC